MSAHSRSPSPQIVARDRVVDRDDGPSKRKRSTSPQPPQPTRKARLDHIANVSVNDVDPERRKIREADLLEAQLAQEQSGGQQVVKAFDPQAEFKKLLGTRTGGAYMPPARLRALQQEAAKDKTSAEYQRLSWDALRKSINGLINKVNVANIKHVVPELFGENLIRGKGLFARAIMRAQASSLPFTPIFAALVAIVNTKLPQVGELVLVRLISQFRRAFKRNDKTVCHATATFIAHLCNQSVAHEIVALQILLLCIERPTDDSIEIAVGFMREVGAFLAEVSPKANNGVYERFRAVLHEGALDKRCQYMIEVLFQVRKDKYKDNPAIPEGLDLVEEEEQITHRIALDEQLPVQEGLNLFKADPNFLENEERYQEIKKEILGDSDDEDSGSEAGTDDEDSDDEEDDGVAPDKQGIQDFTETNLINLRRTIYLTVMNSLNYEEAVHKLLTISLPEGREIEMCNMIIECCSQERSYNSFFGLIGERFCKLNRVWTECYQEAFQKYYETIHRYETNKLRNIGRFFGHLLASDSISWAVLHVVHMTEDDTTSSSRIFVKILMIEMLEALGLPKLVERFKQPDMQYAFSNILPIDDPKNTRFAINYFTSIGLGAITENARVHLQNAPKRVAEEQAKKLAEESSEEDSSDTTSSSESETSSEESSSDDSDDSRRRSRRSPPRRRARSDSRSRSPPSRNKRRSPSSSRSRSPPPARSRRRQSSTPPPRRAREASTPPRRRSPDSFRRRQDRRRDDSETPPPRRPNSPPPRRANSPPPRRPYSPPRHRDDLPPRRRDDPPPPQRREPLPPRRRDDSPPYGRRDAPPRRANSPPPHADLPPRHNDSHSRRRYDSPPRRENDRR